MFNPGETVTIAVIEDGDGATTYHGLKVLDYIDGLLTVRDGEGNVIMYNVRSLNFVKAIREG